MFERRALERIEISQHGRLHVDGIRGCFSTHAYVLVRSIQYWPARPVDRPWIDKRIHGADPVTLAVGRLGISPQLCLTLSASLCVRSGDRATSAISYILRKLRNQLR